MSYLAIVTGLSGREAYLGRDGAEVCSERLAKRFRCAASALEAGRGYLGSLPRVVARHMALRAVETASGDGQETVNASAHQPGTA